MISTCTRNNKKQIITTNKFTRTIDISTYIWFSFCNHVAVSYLLNSAPLRYLKFKIRDLIFYLNCCAFSISIFLNKVILTYTYDTVLRILSKWVFLYILYNAIMGLNMNNTVLLWTEIINYNKLLFSTSLKFFYKIGVY